LAYLPCTLPSQDLSFAIHQKKNAALNLGYKMHWARSTTYLELIQSYHWLVGQGFRPGILPRLQPSPKQISPLCNASSNHTFQLQPSKITKCVVEPRAIFNQIRPFSEKHYCPSKTAKPSFYHRFFSFQVFAFPLNHSSYHYRLVTSV
jgi:hypothetical protein